MIEPVLENTDANQEDPINSQDEIPRGEEANDSSILKKRRRSPVDKIICWELVAKAQMMVDVEAVCDTEVTIDDDIVGEGGE
jgi:hypothetical protein